MADTLLDKLWARETGKFSVRLPGNSIQADASLVRRLKPSAALRGHHVAVGSLGWSPDGKLLISAGDDLVLKIWDASRRQQVSSVHSGHMGGITCVRFLPESGNAKLVSCSADKQIRMLDLQKGAVKPFSVHQASVRAVAALSPDVVLSAAEDGRVRRVDMREPIPGRSADKECQTAFAARSLIVEQFQEDTGAWWAGGPRVGITCLAVDPTASHMFATGGSDSLVRLYDLRMLPRQQHARPSQTSHGASWVACFAPDHLAASPHAANDQRQQPWMRRTGCTVTGLTYNHTGSLLLASYCNDDIYTFHVKKHARSHEALQAAMSQPRRRMGMSWDFVPPPPPMLVPFPIAFRHNRASGRPPLPVPAARANAAAGSSAVHAAPGMTTGEGLPQDALPLPPLISLAELMGVASGAAHETAAGSAPGGVPQTINSSLQADAGGPSRGAEAPITRLHSAASRPSADREAQTNLLQQQRLGVAPSQTHAGGRVAGPSQPGSSSGNATANGNSMNIDADRALSSEQRRLQSHHVAAGERNAAGLTNNHAGNNDQQQADGLLAANTINQQAAPSHPQTSRYLNLTTLRNYFLSRQQQHPQQQQQQQRSNQPPARQVIPGLPGSGLPRQQRTPPKRTTQGEQPSTSRAEAATLPAKQDIAGSSPTVEGALNNPAGPSCAEVAAAAQQPSIGSMLANLPTFEQNQQCMNTASATKIEPVSQTHLHPPSMAPPPQGGNQHASSAAAGNAKSHPAQQIRPPPWFSILNSDAAPHNSRTGSEPAQPSIIPSEQDMMHFELQLLEAQIEIARREGRVAAAHAIEQHMQQLQGELQGAASGMQPSSALMHGSQVTDIQPISTPAVEGAVTANANSIPPPSTQVPLLATGNRPPPVLIDSGTQTAPRESEEPPLDRARAAAAEQSFQGQQSMQPRENPTQGNAADECQATANAKGNDAQERSSKRRRLSRPGSWVGASSRGETSRQGRNADQRRNSGTGNGSEGLRRSLSTISEVLSPVGNTAIAVAAAAAHAVQAVQGWVSNATSRLMSPATTTTASLTEAQPDNASLQQPANNNNNATAPNHAVQPTQETTSLQPPQPMAVDGDEPGDMQPETQSNNASQSSLRRSKRLRSKSTAPEPQQVDGMQANQEPNGDTTGRERDTGGPSQSNAMQNTNHQQQTAVASSQTEQAPLTHDDVRRQLEAWLNELGGNDAADRGTQHRDSSPGLQPQQPSQPAQVSQPGPRTRRRRAATPTLLQGTDTGVSGAHTTTRQVAGETASIQANGSAEAGLPQDDASLPQLLPPQQQTSSVDAAIGSRNVTQDITETATSNFNANATLQPATGMLHPRRHAYRSMLSSGTRLGAMITGHPADAAAGDDIVSGRMPPGGVLVNPFEYEFLESWARAMPGAQHSTQGYERRFSGHCNKNYRQNVSFLGPGCEYVASGSDHGHIHVWNTHTGELVVVLKQPTEGSVEALQAHPFELMLATSGGEEPLVQLWQPADEPTPLYVSRQIAEIAARLPPPPAPNQRARVVPPWEDAGNVLIQNLLAGLNSYDTEWQNDTDDADGWNDNERATPQGTRGRRTGTARRRETPTPEDEPEQVGGGRRTRSASRAQGQGQAAGDDTMEFARAGTRGAVGDRPTTGRRRARGRRQQGDDDDAVVPCPFM